jgi:hypothetical protein
MLKQLSRAIDVYYSYQLATLIVLLIAATAYFFFVHLPKTKENFQDPNQPLVPVETALPKIKENFNQELAIIDKMTSYYENFTKIAANSKADKPSDLEKGRQQVEQDMQKEAPGKIIKLPYVKSTLDYLKTLTSAPEINRLYIGYLLLPKDINMYISTGEYLDTKGKQLYDYVATLGKSAPSGGTKKEQTERKEITSQTQKVQGSTGDTFGTNKTFSGPDGFVSGPEMPDCCTRNKVESLKLSPQQISDLYYISNTRSRKIEESTINSVLEKLEATYKKLNDLQSQVESGGGATFGKIASGQSVETALTAGFTDYDPHYAYLIYK